MSLAVTPIYAGLLALIFIALSLHVIFRRRAARVAVGDGGDKELQKRMRVHANFAEFVPLALVLLLMAELQGAPHWALHVLGLMLLAGRCAHVAGMLPHPQILLLRQVGVVATFIVIMGCALAMIAHAVI